MSEIPESKIKEIDEYVLFHNVDSMYADSLLKVYPDSDYIKGLQLILDDKHYNDEKSLARLLASEKNLGTYLLGAIAYRYSAFGEYQKAESYYLKSLEHDKLKKNWWTRVDLALLYNDVFNEFEKSDYYIGEANLISPNNPRVKSHQAYLFINQRLFDDALEILNTIPANYEPSYILQLKADISLLENSLNEALYLYTQSLHSDSNNITSHIGVIDVYLLEKKFDEAQEKILVLNDKYPNNELVQNRNGLILASMGNYEESTRIFEKLTQTQPEIHNFTQLALNYIELKKFNKAQLTIENAGELLGWNFELYAHKILCMYYTSSKDDIKHAIYEYYELYDEYEDNFLVNLLNNYDFKLEK